MKKEAKTKVLLVEDESTLSMIIKDTLDGENFETITARNGREGLDLFHQHNPAIVIADVMMPVLDGFSMVQEIRRKEKSVPILFLTARTSLDDLVKGFNLGANDYLKKPFKMMELVVRVKALTNHIATIPEENLIYYIGHFKLNCQSQTLSFNGSTEELSYMECGILRQLAANIGNVVEINYILNDVWDNDNYYNRNSLHVFIHKLRKKLSRDSRIKILNIRGVGYKLIVE